MLLTNDKSSARNINCQIYAYGSPKLLFLSFFFYRALSRVCIHTHAECVRERESNLANAGYTCRRVYISLFIYTYTIYTLARIYIYIYPLGVYNVSRAAWYTTLIYFKYLSAPHYEAEHSSTNEFNPICEAVLISAEIIKFFTIYSAFSFINISINIIELDQKKIIFVYRGICASKFDSHMCVIACV